MIKIRSIFNIFAVFLIMITMCFLILYSYSTTNLKESLIQTVKIQMDYSKMIFSQKIKEIEIEADGILNSDDLKALHITMNDEYDAYRYITDVNQMKAFMKSRQKSNVGMAQFILYWPKSNRVITTSSLGTVKSEMLEKVADNLWFTYANEVFFSRKYTTDWDENDDEPFLVIRMERDFLYKIKTMAFGMEKGGTILLTSQNQSFFSLTESENELISSINRNGISESVQEISINHQKYQIVQSESMSNIVKLVSYYPIKVMMKPVTKLNRITGGLLLVILLVGLIFMVLYYRNILMQLNIFIQKLKQVEMGNFKTQIVEFPNNEFDYVFGQFNSMVSKISQLIESSLKEQKLRNQAELRQLQLQIHPHFLYNSLSYIVTVSEQPQAVTDMAVHLSNYYRYCTKNKSITTIGEEISYAKDYLEISAMRKNIEYTIEVSSKLYHKKVIPLILQPIIENAIEHAIEAFEHANHISVEVSELDHGAIRFSVSDDGEGLSMDEMEALMGRISIKEQGDHDSIGLWNVNQRLINYYNKSASLHFEKNASGGLTVSFTILSEER